MTGLWSVLILFVQFTTANRERWIAPLPDVSITPTRPVRHEKDFGPDSAYRLLMRAGELPKGEEMYKWLDWPKKERWPAHPPQPFAREQVWSPQHYATVRSFLDRCEPNLALARRAVAAPNPQFPTVMSLTSSDDLKPILKVRPVARLLILSAYRHAGEGGVAKAMDDLLTAIRVGNLASRGRPMIAYVVDVAISRMGTEAIWRIATRNDVPAPVLRQTAKRLLVIADHAEPFAETLRYEAKGMLAACGELWNAREFSMAGKGGQEFAGWALATAGQWLTGSSPKAVRRDFTYLYQHLVQLAQQPYDQGTRRRVDSLTGPTSGWMARALFADDVVGWLLASMLAPAYSQTMAGPAVRDARLKGTALYLVIRAYQADHGSIPKQLADLVPGYLPKVPLDPFSGKPFRYVTKDIPPAWGDVKWGIYSLGPNFVDDGGKPAVLKSGVGKKERDIVWIPRVTPAQ